MACKALASVNWFVDQEVQNKTRELGGMDIVRRVKEAHLDHALVASTCDQVLCLLTMRCNMLRSARLRTCQPTPRPLPSALGPLRAPLPPLPPSTT